MAGKSYQASGSPGPGRLLTQMAADSAARDAAGLSLQDVSGKRKQPARSDSGYLSCIFAVRLL